MKVTLVKGAELGPQLTHTWRAIQELNPALQSPYFSPEFTSILGQVRGDVEVAVLEEGGDIAAFFPFQRQGKVGHAVGGILSDFHGVICRPGFLLDARRLVKSCKLVTWDFDHLLTDQPYFARFHRYVEPSPQVNLAGGYDAYVAALRAGGSEQVRKAANLARRAERELGPLRFQPHSTDKNLVDTVLGWKSKQYLAGGLQDLMTIGWIRATLECVHNSQEEGLSGAFSVLMAGERPIAGHFGMRSRAVWHYWFPAYDIDMAKYSPGILLLLKLLEHAAGSGVEVLDLGKGMSAYKERLMNTSVPVAVGSVETHSWLRCRRTFGRAVRQTLQRTGLSKPANLALRWLRAKKP